MDLFEIVNGHVTPSTHALLIEPFKSMWNNDETPHKSNAMKAFQYIELMCSPKRSNPYYGSEIEVRVKKVKKEVYGNEDYELNIEMIFAVDKYKELLEESSSTYRMIESSIAAATKLRTYFDTFDFNHRTNSGAMIIKPKEVTAALKEIPDVVKSLETLRDKVNDDLAEGGQTRAGRKVGAFER